MALIMTCSLHIKFNFSFQLLNEKADNLKVVSFDTWFQ